MRYTEIVETLGSFIDIGGVLLIVFGLFIATARYILAFRTVPESYKAYRQDIGRAILLGLEVLVAADIVRTVAVTPDTDKRCRAGRYRIDTNIPQLQLGSRIGGPFGLANRAGGESRNECSKRGYARRPHLTFAR
jgi:uncharacterized membrane protein